ncbi:hypothetical protein GOV10_05445, partial [Candidatus Woesearchaeota archaeon]|nr:hypothetical protein [Candidatus Woesearchaeota archaeon]
MLKQNNLPKLPRSIVTLTLILILTFIFLSRWFIGAPLTPLDNSYAHLATAQTISGGQFVETSLYNYLLAFMPFPWLLPVILGLLSFHLLGRLLEKKLRSYALFLFIVTPLALTLFTAQTQAALFFPVALLAFLMYQKGNRFDFITILLGALLPLIDLLAGIVVLLVMSLYALHEGRGRVAGFFILINVLFILVALFMGFDPNFSLPGMFFGELGDPYGYSLFIVLLAVFTMMSQIKSLDTGHVLLVTLLFALSALLPTLRPLVLVPLIVSAAHALHEFATKKWALPFLKQASTLLLVCLALFVALSHAQLLIDSEPQPPIVELAEYVGLDVREGGILVSEDIDGSVLFYSQKPVVVFGYEDSLFSSVTIDASAPVLRENGVRFFIVSPVLEELAWGRSERGMRFLMLHNEKFINIMIVEEYELWLVLPE